MLHVLTELRPNDLRSAMQMRHPAKPSPRTRQRSQVQPVVVNASKRVDDPRVRATRASDPSRKIRTPVGDLTRGARSHKGKLKPQHKAQRAQASSNAGWEEEPTLVQRENVLKRMGTLPATNGRQPLKSAPPVQRKARTSTRPPPAEDNLDDVPTQVLQPAVKRETQRAPSNDRARQVSTGRSERARSTTERPKAILHRVHARPDASAQAVQPIALERRRTQGGEQRWLLLLKVGKEQLARVWNQGLASCEPIVWRPTTKAWAPLFDVPQIAAFVTSIPPEEVAGGSTAPAIAPDTVRSPPPSDVVAESGRRSSLDELGTDRAVPAHVALRSPHIPRPPRVPRDTVQGPFGRLGESQSPMRTTGQGARATVRPPAPAASPTPALRVDAEVNARPADSERAGGAQALPAVMPRPAANEVAGPTTERAGAAAVPRPDSYAPQARSVRASSERASGHLIERAAWLMVGVVLALVLTLFPEVTFQLRSQLAQWIAPEPETVQGSEVPRASAARQAVSAKAAKPEAKAEDEPAAKDESEAKAREKKKGTSVAVDDLFAKKADEGEKSGARDDEGGSDRATRDASARSEGSSAEAGSAAKATSPTRSAPKRAAAKSDSGESSSSFDTAAARRALASSVQRAQFCAAERATGTVTVTFAPTGGVQNVGLANLSGSEVRKGCVIRAFRGARIRPFSGSPVTVQKSFRLR